MTIAIYLAGSITKGHEQMGKDTWLDEHREVIRERLSDFNVILLDPAIRGDDLNDARSTFGRDLFMVSTADIVLVDVRGKRGIGVGAEMMWAKCKKVPLIAWAPDGTHYNCKDTSILGVRVESYVHPFVEALPDARVQSLEEACTLIRDYMTGKREVKGEQSVFDAIEYYLETQLENDTVMQEHLSAYPELKERIEKSLI